MNRLKIDVKIDPDGGSTNMAYDVYTLVPGVGWEFALSNSESVKAEWASSIQGELTAEFPQNDPLP